MDLKIKEAITWGKFVSIFGFIASVMSILSCVGIPAGVLMLMAFMKLNNATDALKAIDLKGEAATVEDYKDVISLYGNYLKMLGIMAIVTIVLSILLTVFYVVLFGAIISTYTNVY